MNRVRFKVTYFFKNEEMPHYAFFKSLELAKEYRDTKMRDVKNHDFHIEKIKLKWKRLLTSEFIYDIINTEIEKGK